MANVYDLLGKKFSKRFCEKKISQIFSQQKKFLPKFRNRKKISKKSWLHPFLKRALIEKLPKKT